MTGADAARDSDAGPSRSVEVEAKFDVDPDTSLPDWTSVPGVVSVGPSELRELDARYYDTAEFALASAEYAVRRRTGGHDAGWHIKGPRVGGARVELGWPLGADDDDSVPEALRAELTQVTTDDLLPIARIRNRRTAYALCDADGEMVAEFVDDHVTATDFRAGAERAWREWEIELGPAAPADVRGFFAAVERAVLAAGGRPAASSSKLARALGY